MIKGIKHIVFDFGGVLLNIDYTLTEQAFIALGITQFSRLYSQLQQDNMFDELETGSIQTTAFCDTLRKLAGMPLEDQDIIRAWNAMLLNLPLRRLQLLEQLKHHYDLVLLSNTNEIHEEAFTRIIYDEHKTSIAAFFDRVYFSHRVGMRKPDKEIFERVLQENHFLPEHTLFIDDSPQYIEGAKKLGIQTLYLEKGMTIEEHVFRSKTNND